MSHSVTIHRTITSSTNNTTTYVVLNTGYFKTFPGVLKVLQFLIGAAMVGIFSYYQINQNSACWYGINGVIFAFMMSVTFMIGTFCLILACVISLSTGSIIAKTTYEFIYHAVAGILLLTCSIILLVSIGDRYNRHEAYFAAGIMGLVNSILYFISAYWARRQYVFM